MMEGSMKLRVKETLCVYERGNGAGSIVQNQIVFFLN